jgi:putative membrane protein
MDISYIKALHIIFVVSWFAALFYIVRLFIYFAEADKKDEPAKKILQTQYKIMSKRLWYIIGWPSAILSSFFAFYMLLAEPSYLKMGWMHIKLSFVFALYFYHAGCQVIFQQQQKGIVKYSAMKLRIWNEVATVLLFAIVFIVVLKSSLSWIWGVAGIILFGLLMMLGIKIYKNMRSKRDWDNFDQVMGEDAESENDPEEIASTPIDSSSEEKEEEEK